MAAPIYSAAPLAESGMESSNDSTDEERAAPSSGSEDLEAQVMRISRSVLRRALAVAVLGAAAAACILATAGGRRVQARATGPAVSSQLYETYEVGDEITNLPGDIQQVAERVANMPAVSKVLDKLMSSVPKKGCEDNEEEYLGLCYQKCSVLTNGEYPMRSAPEVCCKKKPCLLPSEVDGKGFFPCSGYDVSGTGGCPHTPGHCEENEEYHLGLCYKKCELVSDGEFPIRVAANTCCKARPCWNIFHLKTAGLGCSGFGVGGGVNPGQECAHRPVN